MHKDDKLKKVEGKNNISKDNARNTSHTGPLNVIAYAEDMDILR